MKDGSSLVVTPSSIPSSATRGLDADLFSDEGSEEVLEDSEDEPVMKTRVFFILMRIMMVVGRKPRPWVCVFYS